MRTILKRLLSLGGRLLRRTPLARSDMLNRLHGGLSVWLHGSDTVNVGPFIVQFDKRDRFIAKNLVLYKKFEHKEIELLCSLVEPGDHVLDIGANIGLHTLYLSQAVGPDGRVIAVEPDPDNLRILRNNIETN